MSKIGIVVPTIFGRPKYLPAAVASIAQQNSQILLTCPTESIEKPGALGLAVDQVLAEPPGATLAEKITMAVQALPPEVEYVGWLGDDDLLLPGSLLAAANYLDQHPECVMVYGGCDYIDADGKILFTNPSSQFAATLLSFGPQLIPQPGALWRRSVFDEVGGLSSEFDLAFDFDLFLKLKRVGKLKHLPITLAQFRWHPDSLSVKKRGQSVTEASRVRRKHYRGVAKILWPLWEPAVIAATFLAGKLVSLRLRSD